MKWKLLLCIILLNTGLYAQALYKTIPTIGAKFMQVDEMGNIYIVRKDKTILKYNELGDSVAIYNNISMGAITALDVSNPLMLMVYYGQFNQLVLLDRLLVEKSVIDLKKMELLQVSAAGIANDNQLLIYDIISAKLRKYNDQWQVLMESNDTRQELGMVMQPNQIIDKDSLVFVVTYNKGVHVFNRMLNYLYYLPVESISNVQKIGMQLIFFNKHALYNYQLDNYNLNKVQLPEAAAKKWIDVKVGRNKLYCLSDQELSIYDVL